MSKRFEVLAPTDDSETSNRDNKKKQDTFSKNTLEKRENRFKSKTKNTRFNFPLEKSENKDRPQRYNRDESDNRNSFQRKPRRQFRESFFDRKKYAKQQEVNKTPKPPKNFTLNENDFPTL